MSDDGDVVKAVPSRFARIHPSFRAAVLSLAFVTHGCGGCRSLKADSHVDVPVTLEEVKKLAHPPDVVVTVEREEAPAGGGACGHSAVCVILVPILAYDALFPHKWDRATVRRDGKVAYTARFETGGDFIESTQYQAGKARDFGSLLLTKLGKRVIVQVAEATVGADGARGEPKRVPVLPQVDLIADYEAALGKEKDGDDRAALVVEAATWLGHESVLFLEKHAKDEKEPDETRARIVREVCNLADERRDVALAAAKVRPGPKTAIAGLKCALGDSSLDAHVDFFVGAVADHVCRSKTYAELEELTAAIPGGRPGIEAAAERCTAPSASTLLRVRAGAKVPRADLEAAMRDPGPYADVLSGRLSPDVPDERAALFAGLDAHPGLEKAVQSLARATVTPTADELRPLAKSYAYDAPLSDSSRQMDVLNLFHRAEEAKVDTGRARTEIDAAVSKAKDIDRPVLRAAMMVLGDRQQAVAASRGLDSHSHQTRFGASGDGAVIGAAFLLAGCRPDEIKAAYLQSSRFGDSDRGVLCTK